MAFRCNIFSIHGQVDQTLEYERLLNRKLTENLRVASRSIGVSIGCGPTRASLSKHGDGRDYQARR